MYERGNQAFDEYIEDLRIFAASNSILKRVYDGDHKYYTHLPFTILPSFMSKSNYDMAHSLQPIINYLYASVATSNSFLNFAYEKVLKHDPFMDKLWEIYISSRNSVQDIQMCLLRADYLTHNLDFNETDENSPQNIKELIKLYESELSKTETFNPNLKMVEVNCISVSFGCISPLITQLHRKSIKDIIQYDIDDAKLPKNETTNFMAKALIVAWETYGGNFNLKAAAILFVVEEDCVNEFDQRLLEYEINCLRPEIRVIRKTFFQLAHTATLVSNSKRLFIDGSIEIALIYYRNGYSPNDYKESQDWEMRLLLETSAAIKCPSIQFQLAGTKLVQQVLSTIPLPDIRDRFFGTAVDLPDRDLERLAQTFVKFYPLDDPVTTESHIDYALRHSNEIVLKPLREGGGNNLYGEDVKEFLERYKEELLLDTGIKDKPSSKTLLPNKKSFPSLNLPFVLMELIKPRPVYNLHVKSNIYHTPTQPVKTIGELGIFGAVLCSETKGVIHSKTGGHLLRSKYIGDTETGIMAGYGVLDSPFLI